MIEFFSENDFQFMHTSEVSDWIKEVILEHGFVLGEITYVFCDDEYLLKLNKDFLDHDTLTDIISFDYSMGKELHGEIYISTERVAENASEFNTEFSNELHRVIIHGILHYCGYKDKTEEEAITMRMMEDKALAARIFS